MEQGMKQGTKELFHFKDREDKIPMLYLISLVIFELFWNI